jgi:hypothetical protein
MSSERQQRIWRANTVAAIRLQKRVPDATPSTEARFHSVQNDKLGLASVI